MTAAQQPMKMIDHAFDAEKNLHMYHIGYMKIDAYSEFYDWQRDKKLHFSYFDMPHDYFVFLHEDDRLAMHEMFASHIAPIDHHVVDLDGFHDHTLLQQPDPIADLLMEELTREINRGILHQIGMEPAPDKLN